MENKISDNGAIPKHLAGDELISYLDGELSRGEQFEARTHLESCWKCRSQLNVLQSSIDNFLSLRQESLLPGKLPPSGPAVELFRQRLVEHSASPPPQASSWLRIAHWSSVFSSFTSPFKTVLPSSSVQCGARKTPEVEVKRCVRPAAGGTVPLRDRREVACRVRGSLDVEIESCRCCSGGHSTGCDTSSSFRDAYAPRTVRRATAPRPDMRSAHHQPGVWVLRRCR